MDNQRPGNSAIWDATHARVQTINTGAEARIDSPSHNNQCLQSNHTDINAEDRIGNSNNNDNYTNAKDRIGVNNSQYPNNGNNNDAEDRIGCNNRYSADDDTRYSGGDKHYNNRAGTVGDASNWRGGHDTTPNNYIQPHSPRNQLRQSMDRYARDNNISRKNIGALAQYHDEYHGRVMGHPADIGEQALQNAGFTFKSRRGIYDTAPAYDEIITIHTTIVTQWPTPDDTSKGPQVHRIITKCLSAFPTLRSTSGRAWVDFYDKLQSSGTNFILPLTPFDSIIDVTDYTYLFPPLLGTKRYAACATAILSLLAHIIPTSLSNTLNVLVNTVRSESGNGYDLLHRALKVFVPGFDKSRPLPLPYWTDGTTVHDYSTSMILYFRIQALHQMPHTDYDKSLSFLRGITGSEYTELTPLPYIYG